MSEKRNVIIGIDVGGSTTKIVGFKNAESGLELIEPDIVRANDPVTSTYGAFGKFTDEHRIPISSIERVMMTGVGASYVKHDLYGLECKRVEEFMSIGLGGLYLSNLDDALVVSMGTGTALVHAKKNGEMNYLGGTGVGGGTLVGLSKLILQVGSIDHLIEYAEEGNLDNIDLRIKDIVANDSKGRLSGDLTAANFGKVSEVASKGDIALGIMNMVFETVAMVSVFASRHVGVKDVVLTGNLTRLPFCKEKFHEFNTVHKYGVDFLIPQKSQFSTVIGTALAGLKK